MRAIRASLLGECDTGNDTAKIKHSRCQACDQRGVRMADSHREK